MNRIDSLDSGAAAVACAGSAISTAVCMAADVAVQLFGVPLQVILAALTGALGVRAFLPPAPFWRATAAAAFWTVAGAILSQLALWVAGKAMGSDLPPGALAGVALLTAALGQRVGPILWVNGGEALKRKLDGLFKGGDRG